jgi:hypothetical protein
VFEIEREEGGGGGGSEREGQRHTDIRQAKVNGRK